MRQDFKNVVDQHIDYIKQNANETQEVLNSRAVNGHVNTNNVDSDSVNTISKRVQQVGNGVAHAVANGVSHLANGVNHVANGHGPVRVSPVGKTTNYAELDMQRRENIRNMYSEINHM